MPVPDIGSLRGDLHSLLTHIAEVYGSAQTYGLPCQVIGEACRDPLFRDVLRVLNDRRQAVLKAIFERGAERGEVAKGASADLVGNVVIGYFAGLLSADAMFPDAAGIDQLVQLLLQGGRRPGGRRVNSPVRLVARPMSGRSGRAGQLRADLHGRPGPGVARVADVAEGKYDGRFGAGYRQGARGMRVASRSRSAYSVCPSSSSTARRSGARAGIRVAGSRVICCSLYGCRGGNAFSPPAVAFDNGGLS
ncbi:TetR-like C-terminal domain-containing protein [Embleya sp. NPDC050493]|uniref:TetR-like C-terminal domain-containing protein n=1 Tax=Embleya sp. NPDC050493 TaxID=3363989 RepID=UPI0037899FF6